MQKRDVDGIGWWWGGRGGDRGRVHVRITLGEWEWGRIVRDQGGSGTHESDSLIRFIY